MTWPSIALLAFVTLQRLVELPIANANTKRLLTEGAYEVGGNHHPLLVALHASWLASLWWFGLGRPIDLPFLALFVLIEIGRVWVLRTLGPRWTTRIIVVPGERLVASGPYRFVDHPNYLVVIAEIAVVPAGSRPVAGRGHFLPAERRGPYHPHPRREQGARPLNSLLATLGRRAYIALTLLDIVRRWGRAGVGPAARRFLRIAS